MNPNNFEMQKMKEIGRKEAGESREVSILWMGIIVEDFQMVGKKSKAQLRLKIHAETRKVLQH